MSILKGQNFSQKAINQATMVLHFSEENFLEAFLQRVTIIRLLKKEMVK